MERTHRNTFVPHLESLEDRRLLATGLMSGMHSIFGPGQLAVTRDGNTGPQIIALVNAAAQQGVRGPAAGHAHGFAGPGAGLVSPAQVANLATPNANPGLNDSVLAFALAALGTQVGDGGCWALADQALQAAGADTSGDFSCIFGSSIGLDAVIPGDILQFEGVHFEGPDPVIGGWYWQDFPHHTAIVYAVNGSQITLLNQNINGDTTVQFTTINLADWQTGNIFAYRPQLP
jgi:hypothetical protein